MSATATQPILDSLTRGTRVDGVLPGTSVTVVAVEPHGSDAITLTYRDEAGGLGETMLFGADLERLSLAAAGTTWSFDADGAEFRLVAEALRIRMAGLFDQMLAVSTSDLQPLPHQIRAVYGDLLPRTPLRFLLADDPGAGKTIMAGLYAKELALRGELARCLIIAPGGLVEQWQDELVEKFDLYFTILTPSLVEATPAGHSVFDAHPLLIARMDQLARSDDWLARLGDSSWDLIVVDEAHRMSARFNGLEVKTTARYRLGQRLGGITRHLLLMTATPHAGKEEDFQLFLALLDPDRFNGRYRQGVHTSTTRDLMRRTIKEDLLTFDGRRLFPQRVAQSLPYTLSDSEKELYEQVTRYVRTEMNRARRLGEAGDVRRSNTVGFALTVLQRRLASSPAAIHESLRRRRNRLDERRQVLIADPAAADRSIPDPMLPEPPEDDEFPTAEDERTTDEIFDAATAARTIAELETEIAALTGLERLAQRVRASGQDRKWVELRDLMQDPVIRDADRRPRKLIIFTEHKDTLRYLTDRLGDLIGTPDAVVAIHGGVRREERQRIRERFANDPRCHILLATDAAGEGLNLQCAHLMINYDLPWNPNRIEQRFGRIHRIGQREVCRLWNLVAVDTREGQVFERLLDKIEEQRKAYGGRVFDVLGQSFADKPLREVLLDAVLYGDDPARLTALEEIVDAEVSQGLPELLREQSLNATMLAAADVEALRRQMDAARARRLQPHYLELFFTEAFARLGGRMARRETGRWEITHVPAVLRNRPTSSGRGPAIVERYARITFTTDRIHLDGKSTAVLLAPGHRLLDTVVNATIERHHQALTRGTILVDPHDQGTDPRLLLALTEEITDGTGASVAKRFEFLTLTPTGEPTASGAAPYLDAEPLDAHCTPEQATRLRQMLADGGWPPADVARAATAWAASTGLPAFRQQISEQTLPLLRRTRDEVEARLTQQINFWHCESVKLREEQAAGRTMRITPERATAAAQDLERRLQRRCDRLDAQARLLPKPPQLAGAALVLPYGYLAACGLGTPEQDPQRPDAPAPDAHAIATAEVDRRAIAAVLAAERALGREPVEMPHNNPGYDLESVDADGRTVFIEVKGRLLGAQDFHITYNEVLLAKNTAGQHRLALVAVHPDGPAGDEVRYVTGLFADVNLGSFAATAVRGDWRSTWDRGTPPH
ncbi:MAG: DUF3883 domain-containing protein [Micromonosporaceae bacterium]|nr:DUF3883 domain-containing protein [Micromonosporaceae bacterium]